MIKTEENVVNTPKILIVRNARFKSFLFEKFKDREPGHRKMFILRKKCLGKIILSFQRVLMIFNLENCQIKKLH